MGRLLALYAALIAAAIIGVAAERTPRSLGADAPATVFSAQRAMADVRAMGTVAHPVGSPANSAVREHLLARMSALGLSPTVHQGDAFQVLRSTPSPQVGGAHVENIVGVLPGRDRAAPALALMAHYDSVPNSPGAADDMAGVATALETVRAIAARGVPSRDVVVLITDGEEVGLLGARAFFARDPMARHIGFILNMETRGSGGRTQMFETGLASGGAIALFRRTAVNPQASSLSSFLYRYMPADTDFSIAKAAGFAGFNYAFIGREFDYHTPSSTPGALDAGAVQDMGQQVLAVTAAVARAPSLPPPGPTPVYGQLVGNVMLAYPTAMGWLVLALTGGLIALGLLRARRTEPFPWRDAGHGAAAALTAMIGGAAVLHFARRATGAGPGFTEHRFLLAQIGRWEIALLLLGVGFLITAAAELARGRRAIAILPVLAGVGSCALGGIDQLGLGLGLGAALLALAAYGRPVSRAGAWSGVLGLGLAIAAALQVLAPAVAFVVAWPLGLASLAAAATALSTRRDLSALAALTLFAGLGLGWIGGLAHGAFLGFDLVEILGLPILLASFLIWPLAQPEEGAPPARLVGPVLLLAGLATLLTVRLNHPFDARHPRLSVVGYQIDQDGVRAWRFSALRARSVWSDAVLQTGGGPTRLLTHWSFGRPRSSTPAPYVDYPRPLISLTREAGGGMRLRAVPPPGARIMTLRLTPDTPTTLTQIAGLPAQLRLPPGGASTVSWAAAPQGIDLVLRPAGPGAIALGYVAAFDSWPAGAVPLPRRPPEVMAFGASDSTFVTGERRFTW